MTNTKPFSESEIESALISLIPLEDYLLPPASLEQRLKDLEKSIIHISTSNNREITDTGSLSSYLWQLSQQGVVDVVDMCRVLGIKSINDTRELNISRLIIFLYRIKASLETAQNWIHYHFATLNGFSVEEIRAKGGFIQNTHDAVHEFEHTYSISQLNKLHEHLDNFRELYELGK